MHDRIYHPEDIPPPLPDKKRSGIKRTFSSDSSHKGLTHSNTDYGAAGPQPGADTGGMKVEEKIARAYHRDLSWRKVLVRLEPDAHNNICVRRMFSNAYGWPVVKHLVDTHFSSDYAAVTADEHEPSSERAKPITEPVGERGEELKDELPNPVARTDSEVHEAKDGVSELREPKQQSTMGSSVSAGGRGKLSRQDSAQWDDAMFDVTDDEDEDEEEPPLERRRMRTNTSSTGETERGTTDAEVADFLSAEPEKAPEGLGMPTRPEAVVTSQPGMAEEMTAIPSGGTAGVGLGKSVQEQVRKTGEEGGQSGILKDMTRMKIEDR